MRAFLGFFLGLAVALSACTAPTIVKTGERKAPGLDAHISSTMDEIERMTRDTMRSNSIPGLSIALCNSSGMIWEAGFGYADDNHKIPVSGDTIFSIQSMSKTFTAVGVLAAVRERLLDLDKPISRYIPGFRLQSIFEDRPQDKITLRHLLSHTAGFTHEAPGGGNYDPATPSFDEHIAKIQDTWLMFHIGERFKYSNLGIDLAGYIAEKASGRPFIDYMKEKVFQPLHLNRTTVDPKIIFADRNRAIGHQPGSRDLPVIVPMMGAGGVYSSAHDLGRFVTFMLQRGNQDPVVLAPEQFTEMETTPSPGGKYGLGLAINERNGDFFFNHGGGGYGFLTYMAWYTTLDIGNCGPDEFLGTQLCSYRSRRESH